MFKRVLMVDDETAILMAFKKLLKSPYVDVDTAESVEDAEALLNERTYAAVIVDLSLSGSSGEEGLDIIRSVKKRCPKTQVILMTAYGNTNIMDKTYNLGAAFYLEKPVSSNLLKDALKKLGVE